MLHFSNDAGFILIRKKACWGALLILAVIYLFILQVWAIWPFTIDDMYITLRYAKHWADGYGLVWNIGKPPVEGYSNFSFVLLARMALSLHLSPVLVLKGAGVMWLFFTCWAIYAISSIWLLKRFALIPCLWLLAYKGQILWSVSGLETTVYEALICFAVFFIFRGFSNIPNQQINTSFFFILAGFFLALAGLTRPEAPALMALFAFLVAFNSVSSSDKNGRYLTIDFFPNSTAEANCFVDSVLESSCTGVYTPVLRAESPRTSLSAASLERSLIFCCTFVVCFVPYFFWRWHYYGRLFPNPVYCKGFTNISMFDLDKDYLKLAWPFFILGLPALWKNYDRRYLFLWLPSLVYLILLVGADPIVAFDNRLFLPAFALLLPLAAKGMAILLTPYFCQQKDVFTFAMYIAAFLVAFFFIPGMSLAGYRYFTEQPLAGEHLREDVIQWLKNNTHPNSQVVLADSGLIPYKSAHQFTDSYCLNNAEMTKLPPSLMYKGVCENVLKAKPEVIILTSLIEDGKVTYTPADACLSTKLVHNKAYCLRSSLVTSKKHAAYRYEIFTACKAPKRKL